MRTFDVGYVARCYVLQNASYSLLMELYHTCVALSRGAVKNRQIHLFYALEGFYHVDFAQFRGHRKADQQGEYHRQDGGIDKA